MIETEKERVLRMVADGTLRPQEAAQLLAALSDEPIAPVAAPSARQTTSKSKPDDKETVEVQVQRLDGTMRTVRLPPGLVPMFWELAKTEIKESAKSAAQDTWAGLKTMVRNKTKEVKSNVQERFTTAKVKPNEPPPPDQTEVQQAEARRQILQMVQNGRISAEDASRLIHQLDAHTAFQKLHEQPGPVAATGKKR